MEFVREGHATAPTRKNDRDYRPSSVSAEAEPLRNGMTATGSHEYFYSLRGAQPPGEGSSQKNGAGSSELRLPPTRREAIAPPGVLTPPQKKG